MTSQKMDYLNISFPDISYLWMVMRITNNHAKMQRAFTPTRIQTSLCEVPTSQKSSMDKYSANKGDLSRTLLRLVLYPWR